MNGAKTRQTISSEMHVNTTKVGYWGVLRDWYHLYY